MRTMFSAKSSERTSCRASARRISSHHIASAGCELRMARELGGGDIGLVGSQPSPAKARGRDLRTRKE